MYCMGRNKEIWGLDALAFKPERWETKTDVDDYFFPVFNAGYRTCLGKRMALIETLTYLVQIVSQYRIKAIGPLNEEYVVNPTLTYKDGVRLAFTPRHVQE